MVDDISLALLEAEELQEDVDELVRELEGANPIDALELLYNAKRALQRLEHTLRSMEE